MNDKDYFLTFWGYTLGTPEAEAAWAAKCAMKPINVDAPLVVIFNEGFYEHIADKPIYIKSRKQLRAVCKEHNCTSDYAE